MKKIVVYDLNQTLYRKSSKDEFFRFISRKKGHKFLYFFQISWMYLLKRLHIVGTTFFKENFFNYLKHLPPQRIAGYARDFWQEEYPENFREDLVQRIKEAVDQGVEVYIITGGLEVYTKYLEELLPVKVVGTLTIYVKGNYKIIGKACNGTEKIRRLQKEAGADYRLLKAYSDEDEEILHHAKKGYLVKDSGMEGI